MSQKWKEKIDNNNSKLSCAPADGSLLTEWSSGWANCSPPSEAPTESRDFHTQVIRNESKRSATKAESGEANRIAREKCAAVSAGSNRNGVCTTRPITVSRLASDEVSALTKRTINSANMYALLHFAKCSSSYHAIHTQHTAPRTLRHSALLANVNETCGCGRSVCAHGYTRTRGYVGGGVDVVVATGAGTSPFALRAQSLGSISPHVSTSGRDFIHLNATQPISYIHDSQHKR